MAIGFREAKLDMADGLTFANEARAAKLARAAQVAAEAQGFKSLNTGINPQIVAEYLDQMKNNNFTKIYGAGGYHYDGIHYFNEGNHRMNAAIQYKIITGDYKYMDILMKNGKFDKANPVNYGKVYKFPVKPSK